MISIVDTQTALVQWMKANTAIVAVVPSTYGIEIRELEWQGDKFVFPNIRVRIDEITPEMSNCNKGAFEGRIWVFSEEPSSLECNTIGGVVLEQIHGKSMNVNITTKTVKFLGIAGKQLGADMKVESKLWVSLINLSGEVS